MSLPDHSTERGPIEILVYAIILSATKQQARFIRVAEGSVRFWIDGTWHEEMTPPRKLFVPIVRRFGVMIGSLPPAPDQWIAGRIKLRVGDDRMICGRVRIEHDEESLNVLVELVSEIELARSEMPTLPGEHPYRDH